MEIRRLRAGDRLDPGRIAPEVFDHGLDAGHLARFLADPGHALVVAEAKGIVIGQLRALRVRHPDKAPEMMIENLGVTPDWQRRGVATRLLDAARGIAAEWGCAGAYVLTETDNGPALALYRARGWPESAVVMFDMT